MRRAVLQFAIAGLFAALPAAMAQPARQQQQTQPLADTPAKPPQNAPDPNESSSKKPDDAPKPADKPAVKPAKAPPPSPDSPNYDPFHAEQDVEIGTFYMHKGDIDAAIPRFEDAIKLRSNFARPRLLLAECYEKKHEPSAAVKYLKEYLKVYPDAPDRKTVEKKIEKLSNK